MMNRTIHCPVDIRTKKFDHRYQRCHLVHMIHLAVKNGIHYAQTAVLWERLKTELAFPSK